MKNGVDKKAIEAGINYIEFRFREADYSSFPKGLMYSIDVFDTWLYDDAKPFERLKCLDIFEALKKKQIQDILKNLLKNICFPIPMRLLW